MMAASTSDSKGAAISKAEYLKRYLSADENDKKSKEKKAKKRRVKVTGKGMKIVDDDVDWKQLNNNEEKENEEEEEEEAPVIAEMVDERPEEVKLLEAFRSSTKWKIIRADDEDVSEEDGESVRHDSPEPVSIRNTRHDSPEPIAVRRTRQDSPDTSPPRRVRHDSPGASPCRLQPGAGSRRHDSTSPPRNPKHSGRTQKTQSRDSSPSRRKTNSSSAGRTGKRSPDSDQSPPRRRGENRRGSDSDQSPPRKRTQQGRASDSDQSPPRRRPKVGQGSDSDQSPPRRRPQGGRDSDTDLSPPRRLDQSQPGMLSGGAAGLVSVEVLRREHEDNRRREKINQPLEDASRNAQTVFRDKSGKRRDIETEREEQRRKAGEKAEKDEKYAQWGRGIAQGQMQQQKVKDALRETEKPLARHRDDEDLDRMLREQLRDGDPMAAMLRRKKERDANLRGVKEKPRYKGPPPPPNRFNIHPGYRWDGVDRSSGFEQKRYSRISDKKAVEEVAYKWSVEDM